MWVVYQNEACSTGGGADFKYGYHVVKGVDLVVPVDAYIPGCPPRPETLIEGLMLAGQDSPPDAGEDGYD